MNCEQCQNEILLHFGQDELPAAVAEHVRGCSDCQKVWDEWNGLAESLPSDQSFVPDNFDIDGMVARVDRAIDHAESAGSSPKTRITNLPVAFDWVRTLPAAAALVLVVGLSTLGILNRDTDELAPTTGWSEFLNEEYADVYAEVSDDEEMDVETTRTLLLQVSEDRSYDAGEILLDDISEEEMAFLEKNFDVGDIL